MKEAATNMPLHPVLLAYVRRHGLEPVQARSDGGLVVVVDGLYRVLLLPAPGACLALTSVLLELGVVREDRRGDCLSALAALAAGLMRDHPSGLVLDTGGDRLLLQQVRTVLPQADWLEGEIAEFVNALAFWRQAADQVAQRWKV